MKGTTTGHCGLYVHVPFCTSKCGYCDFYSLSVAGRDAGGLIDRLVVELEHRLGQNTLPIASVFIGGGTPTVLPDELLARLLEPLAGVAAGDANTEFTVEANPATIDRGKAAILRAAGVNRLSIGAQSFDPGELAVLERLHTPDDVTASVKLARDSGFRRLSLDLIFGIPGQTLASWQASLKRAMDLEVDHLSLYGLTYEPGTPLDCARQSGRISPCGEGPEAEMYTEAVERTRQRGFEQYEISNFARPDQRCRQNLIYWHNEPYIGVGPSAAGYLDGRRYRNVADLEQYVRMIDDSGKAVSESECIKGTLLAGETTMLALRLVEGINVASFAVRLGIEPHDCFSRSIERYVSLGLLTANQDNIALTSRGRLVADSVIADFMTELDEVDEALIG